MAHYFRLKIKYLVNSYCHLVPYPANIFTYDAYIQVLFILDFIIKTNAMDAYETAPGSSLI